MRLQLQEEVDTQTLQQSVVGIDVMMQSQEMMVANHSET